MPGASALAKRTPQGRPDDTRYAGQGVTNIGTRALEGRFTATRSVGSATTFQVACELARGFTAVRVVFAEASPTISDHVIAVAASSAPTASDLNNSSGTWATSTIQGAFGGSNQPIPVAPTATRTGLLVSDWIPVASVARTDGGSRPIVVVRAYMQANTVGMSCYGDGTDDFTNWATRTNGRLWSARSLAGDQVSSPSGFNSTTEEKQSPIVAVQYLADGKVITVGGLGDSITDGRGTYLGEGFISPAVLALAADLGVAIEYANFGWSGQSYVYFVERAIDIMESELRPDVLVFPTGSPNDMTSTLTAAGVANFGLYRDRILAACNRHRVSPCMWTWLPTNSSVRNYGSSDALRVADNTAVLASAQASGIPIADTSTAISGAVSSGQVQIASGSTTDNIHPNDTGNVTLAAVLKPVLREAVRRVHTAAPLPRQQGADTSRTSLQNAVQMVAPGDYVYANTSPVTWYLPYLQPAPRAAGPQVIRLRVRDTAGPVTVGTRGGATIGWGGANTNTTVTVMPGETAQFLTDGSYWLVAITPATAPYRRVKQVSAATVTMDKSAGLWVFTGTAASTWTLPALANNTGLDYTIVNRGSATVTLQRAGSDQLYTSGATATNVSVAAGAKITVANDGTYWLAY